MKTVKNFLNDATDLFNAIWNLVKSLALLVYVYLAAFFFVTLFDAPDVFVQVTSNAMEELSNISSEAERKMLAKS